MPLAHCPVVLSAGEHEVARRYGGERHPFFEDGSVALHDPVGEQRGYVQPPWAVDADGNDVATHYEWNDGALIQVVEHNKSEVASPVIADPTWTYAFDQIGVGAAGYNEPGITYTMATRELKRCFNCSFPIAEAPATYPSAGQNIKLDASPFTAITVPAPVNVATSGSPGFMFRALSTIVVPRSGAWSPIRSRRDRNLNGRRVRSGDAGRNEPTIFRGEHLVECYLIKNGVVVARDTIGVPISAA